MAGDVSCNCFGWIVTCSWCYGAAANSRSERPAWPVRGLNLARRAREPDLSQGAGATQIGTSPALLIGGPTPPLGALVHSPTLLRQTPEGVRDTSSQGGQVEGREPLALFSAAAEKALLTTACASFLSLSPVRSPDDAFPLLDNQLPWSKTVPVTRPPRHPTVARPPACPMLASPAPLARAAALVALAASVCATDRSTWQEEAKITSPTQECTDYSYQPVNGQSGGRFPRRVSRASRVGKG